MTNAMKMLLDAGTAMLDVWGIRPMYAAAVALIFVIVLIAAFWAAVRGR